MPAAHHVAARWGGRNESPERARWRNGRRRWPRRRGAAECRPRPGTCRAHRHAQEAAMVNQGMYRRHAARLLVLVTALGAAGCTGKSTPPAATPSVGASSASPTPSVDPSTAAATQAAVAAYNGYIQTFAVAA